MVLNMGLRIFFLVYDILKEIFELKYRINWDYKYIRKVIYYDLKLYWVIFFYGKFLCM